MGSSRSPSVSSSTGSGTPSVAARIRQKMRILEQQVCQWGNAECGWRWGQLKDRRPVSKQCVTATCLDQGTPQQGQESVSHLTHAKDGT